MSTSDFTSSNAGQCPGSATGEMGVYQTLAINGSTDLSSIIVGETSGCVYGVSLGYDPNNSIYQYTISVDAAGPSGIGSGSICLGFVDGTGDQYSLTITDSTRKTHTVSYNSADPSIQQVSWGPSLIFLYPPFP